MLRYVFLLFVLSSGVSAQTVKNASDSLIPNPPPDPAAFASPVPPGQISSEVMPSACRGKREMIAVRNGNHVAHIQCFATP